MLCSLSHVQLLTILWTVALQAPLPRGFYRQEYWIGLQCPPPGDLPDLRIKPKFPALQEDSLLSAPPLPHSRFHLKLRGVKIN